MRIHEISGPPTRIFNDLDGVNNGLVHEETQNEVVMVHIRVSEVYPAVKHVEVENLGVFV